MIHIINKCLLHICVIVLFFMVNLSVSNAMNINTLLDLTDKQNLLIQAERQFLNKFMNDIIIAKNNRDPSITFSGSIGANYQYSTGSYNTYNPRNLNLSFNKNLFDGYKTEYSIHQANDLYKQAEYNFESLRQNIFLEAINSYLDVIKYNKIKQLTINNLSLSKYYLDFKLEEFALGDLTELELEQSKLDYEINKFNLQKIQKQIEDEENRLKNYTNQKILDISYPDIRKDKYKPSISSNLDYAINNNPDILASDIYIKVLQHEIAIERSANLPKIDFEFGVSKNWDSSPSVNQVDEYSILGKITIPLYESESVKLKEGNIDFDIIKNKKILQDKIFNLKRDIISTWDDIVLLEDEYDIAKKQIEINDRNIITKNKSYDIGVMSKLDIIDSEIKYNDHMINVEELNNKIHKSHYLFLNKLGNLNIKN